MHVPLMSRLPPLSISDKAPSELRRRFTSSSIELYCEVLVDMCGCLLQGVISWDGINVLWWDGSFMGTLLGLREEVEWEGAGEGGCALFLGEIRDGINML
eukprot:CAMPEP_0184666086 /NCGR_PEP_ID=MMETSP0308-20130426/60014_1 /TAXON_ID=38269 /ORGANISM="Gloeochaete witrockiana, Strain SAG 46.84" /LENGTH=99 /DNA_ID=CAMNT_0027110499 /DNA_START=102 /DNA_END=401 /DNA_ORIENTATION=+